jgi:hypothetical protein
LRARDNAEIDNGWTPSPPASPLWFTAKSIISYCVLKNINPKLILLHIIQSSFATCRVKFDTTQRISIDINSPLYKKYVNSDVNNNSYKRKFSFFFWKILSFCFPVCCASPIVSLAAAYIISLNCVYIIVFVFCNHSFLFLWQMQNGEKFNSF